MLLRPPAPARDGSSSTAAAPPCMQLRIDYLQDSPHASLFVVNAPKWSAAVRRTELFTQLLEALPDTFDSADLLQYMPPELALMIESLLPSVATTVTPEVP
jgi:hypothetical protein